MWELFCLETGIESKKKAGPKLTVLFLPLFFMISYYIKTCSEWSSHSLLDLPVTKQLCELGPVNITLGKLGSHCAALRTVGILIIRPIILHIFLTLAILSA